MSHRPGEHKPAQKEHTHSLGVGAPLTARSEDDVDEATERSINVSLLPNIEWGKDEQIETHRLYNNLLKALPLGVLGFSCFSTFVV